MKKQFGVEEVEGGEEEEKVEGGSGVVFLKSYQICGRGAARKLNEKRREWQEEKDTWNVQ
mgnify:CR=1 FL=1